VSVYIGTTGKYGQATGFDLAPENSQEGVFIENGISESGGFYADGDFAIIWSPGDNNRLLRIYDEDNMYSGSTSYERAYIDANGTYYAISDARQKQDISQISQALSKVKALKGVQYIYIKTDKEQKPTEDRTTNLKNPSKKSMGFLAQDVEKILPEVVDTDTLGNKFINYSGIIPVIIEACKDQQNIIESQETKLVEQSQAIADLLKEINALKEEVAKLKSQKTSSN
jgi:hypothetical protein